MLDNNSDVALRVAEAGFPIFPCAQDKKPLVKWRAVSTTDADVIKAWWQQWPSALPAIDCGKSDLVVIDCDRHDDGQDGVAAFAALCKEYDQSLDDLLIVKTPSGGRHVYFRQPANGEVFGNGRGALPAGIDVRGAGGYVIAPGAQLADGRRYETTKSLDIKSELPAWSAQILRSNNGERLTLDEAGERERAYASAALDGIAVDLAACAPGGRNNTLNNAAFRLGTMIARGWLARGEAENRLTDAATACGLVKDDGMRSVKQTIKSGLDAGTRQPRCDLENREPTKEQPATADPLDGFTFDGVEQITPPPMLVDELLPTRGLAIAGGQSGAGKTFVAILLATCLAGRKPFFGKDVSERVGALYVAAEGQGMIAARFAAAKDALGLDIEKPLPIAWLKAPPPLNTKEQAEAFAAKLRALDAEFRKEHRVRLGVVILDTVAATFEMKDENDNAEAAKACARMRQIADAFGGLVVPVHHYGKTPEAGLRGASAWRAGGDVVLAVLAEIDPFTGHVERRELAISKARDGVTGPIAPFTLEFTTLGTTASGKEFGTCYVAPNLGGETRFGKAKGRPNRSDTALRDAVIEALDGGSTITVRGNTVRAATVEAVRLEFNRRYAVSENDELKAARAKRVAFNRALTRLPREFGMGETNGSQWIWRA